MNVKNCLLNGISGLCLVGGLISGNNAYNVAGEVIDPISYTIKNDSDLKEYINTKNVRDDKIAIYETTAGLLLSLGLMGYFGRNSLEIIRKEESNKL
jgi:hypothetical protein